MATEIGYFFISDITGYTQFLTPPELDHAKEIQDALFESILENIQPPVGCVEHSGFCLIHGAIPADAW